MKIEWKMEWSFCGPLCES